MMTIKIILSSLLVGCLPSKGKESPGSSSKRDANNTVNQGEAPTEPLELPKLELACNYGYGGGECNSYYAAPGREGYMQSTFCVKSTACEPDKSKALCAGPLTYSGHHHIRRRESGSTMCSEGENDVTKLFADGIDSRKIPVDANLKKAYELLLKNDLVVGDRKNLKKCLRFLKADKCLFTRNLGSEKPKEMPCALGVTGPVKLSSIEKVLDPTVYVHLWGDDGKVSGTNFLMLAIKSFEDLGVGKFEAPGGGGTFYEVGKNLCQ